MRQPPVPGPLLHPHSNPFLDHHSCRQRLTHRLYRQLAHKLAALEPDDPVRHKHEALLLEKLYDMGILGAEGAGGRGKLSEVEHKVTVSSFCRRRLAASS